jgi:hypothetical protein
MISSCYLAPSILHCYISNQIGHLSTSCLSIKRRQKYSGVLDLKFLELTLIKSDAGLFIPQVRWDPISLIHLQVAVFFLNKFPFQNLLCRVIPQFMLVTSDLSKPTASSHKWI